MVSTPTVEMYTDPLCPWAWLTSRWLLEAEAVRDFQLVTKVFSLADVNAENEDYRDYFQKTRRTLRLMVAARRVGGEPAIRSVYAALGQAHHERDEPLAEEATLHVAAAAAGIPAQLVADAMADSSDLQEEMLAEHRAAVERGAFGVPTLSVDGSPAYFGPVVDRRITGEEAGTLWDITLPLLLHPHVFELKRNRTSEPDIGRIRVRQAAVASSS